MGPRGSSKKNWENAHAVRQKRTRENVHAVREQAAEHCSKSCPRGDFHYQAITKHSLTITKPLPSTLWPVPSHYQAPFGHYQDITKPGPLIKRLSASLESKVFLRRPGSIEKLLIGGLCAYRHHRPFFLDSVFFTSQLTLTWCIRLWNMPGMV